jgi:hypothetical protein
MTHLAWNWKQPSRAGGRRGGGRADRRGGGRRAVGRRGGAEEDDEQGAAGRRSSRPAGRRRSKPAEGAAPPRRGGRPLGVCERETTGPVLSFPRAPRFLPRGLVFRARTPAAASKTRPRFRSPAYAPPAAPARAESWRNRRPTPPRRRARLEHR